MNLKELRERLWWELDNGQNVNDLSTLTAGNDVKLINEAIRDLADCLHIVKHDKTLLPSSVGVITLPSDFLEVLRVKYKDTDLKPVTNVLNLSTGTNAVTQYLLSGRTKMELYDTPPVVPTGLTVAPQGTPGTTTYGYRVSAVTSRGTSLLSAEATTSTGNAVLSGTSYNRLTWNAVAGATSYRVYRTTSGSATVSTGFLADTASNTYDDTGSEAVVDISLENGDYLFHLWYRAYPATLVNDTDEPADIPSEYHEKLVSVYAKAQFVRKFDYGLYQNLMHEWWNAVKNELRGVVFARYNPVYNDGSWEW